jgi:hypothetical protein
VNITNPTTGEPFTAPATVTISADANDSDGISKVEFFQGSTLLGEDSFFPYEFAWNNVGPGNYSLTAIATDYTAAKATSAPVLITVSGGNGETPVNFKVAFIGDQGLNVNSVAVLNFIKNEGAQAVLHQGDLGYTSDTAAWEAQINSVLGPNFPYFVSIGNADDSDFVGPTGYQQLLTNRMNRLGITWSGNLGIRSSFHYKGIFIVQVAPGITGFDTLDMDVYVRDQLAQDNSIWSISSWHKDMKLMQAGGKSDETGWGVYEESRKGGAIIATGHEHSYERTHLLSSMINQSVASTSNTLTLTKGNSFVFVSGLGGESVRVQKLGGPWWANIYTLTCLAGDPVCRPNANYGALFGIFNVDGQANKAFFYFKDINGLIVDSFTVISNVEPTPTPTP